MQHPVHRQDVEHCADLQAACFGADPVIAPQDGFWAQAKLLSDGPGGISSLYRVFLYVVGGPLGDLSAKLS